MGTIRKLYILQIAQPRHFQEPLGIIIWEWFTFTPLLNITPEQSFSPFLLNFTYNIFIIVSVLQQPGSNKDLTKYPAYIS